jgi:ABC-type Fe3+-hydroxamate transport system substrate-binding protein
MAAGNDTFINTLLEKIGLENFLKKTSRYPELKDEEIQKLKPDLIFLSSEPYPFKAEHIEELQVLCPASKIILVDGEIFSWYGSRLTKAPSYFNSLKLR